VPAREVAASPRCAHTAAGGEARSVRKVALTALAATSIEWYDFFLYGTAAALIFPTVFFPAGMPPLVSLLASFSTFLEIPGVPGESVDPDHRAWIDVTALSVGVTNRACNGFLVTKRLDSASPLLSAAALTGTVFQAMTVDTVDVDARDRSPFLTYTLSNVVVGAVSVAVMADGQLVEHITLQPATIHTSYRPQDSQGNLGPAVESTISCKYR
jgi:type VI protein secretion system component Hcp